MEAAITSLKYNCKEVRKYGPRSGQRTMCEFFWSTDCKYGDSAFPVLIDCLNQLFFNYQYVKLRVLIQFCAFE